jgi:hypothetical protein
MSIWGFGMSCGRSAILILITFTLLCPPLRGFQLSGATADPIHARVTCHTQTSIGWLPSFRPSRRATLSQFFPWKGRLKSVLTETIQEITDECDLGPAVLPDRLVTLARLELTTPPLATCAPLRC